MNKGVISIGVKAPIIKAGDDIISIVSQAVLSEVEIADKDVIGVTESIVARAQNNYVTVDDMVQFMREHSYSKDLVLYSPIMSRNRFSIILKAFARYADSIIIVLDGKYDEQGNPNYEVNQFTGVDILEYYNQICKSENCEMIVMTNREAKSKIVNINSKTYIDCRCHPTSTNKLTLAEVMNTPITRADGQQSGFNRDYGVLGSNKADEEKLKLFPEHTSAYLFCCQVQNTIKKATGKTVEVMVYGDGCFKDPIGGIWEFADPVTSPGYTKGLEGTPNEIKVKYFADSKYNNLSGEQLNKAIQQEIEDHKNKSLVGDMKSEGTTPRRYVDLLASLMDLTSGSGSRCTPIVVVKNYFE